MIAQAPQGAKFIVGAGNGISDSVNPICVDDGLDVVFNYGLRMRPYGLGTTPKDVSSWLSNNVISQLRMKDNELEFFSEVEYRHGIVQYERELTPEEIKSFELVDLNISTKHRYDEFVLFIKEMREYGVSVEDFIADYIHPDADLKSENPIDHVGSAGMVKIISLHLNPLPKTKTLLSLTEALFLSLG